MKKLIFVALLLVSLASPCLAEITVNMQGLTDAQKAEVVQKVESIKEESRKAAAPAVPKADLAKEWVNVASNAADAVATFAGKLGVAGDQFLRSTTGKIIAVLLVFNYGGSHLLDVLIHMVSALIVLAIGLPVWFYGYKTLACKTTQSTSRLKEQALDATGKVVALEKDVLVGETEIDNNWAVAHWVFFAVIWGAALITAFSY